MNERELLDLLELELNSHETKLERRCALEIVRACLERGSTSTGFAATDGDEGRESSALRLHACLRQLIREHQDRITYLRKRDADFRVAYSRTIAEDDRRELILSFAESLGATKRQLRGDRKAFARQFGEDAVRDRFIRRMNKTERRLNVCLQRFGVITAFLIRTLGRRKDKQRLWVRIGVEETIKPLLAYDGDPRVVCTAFRALSRALRELPIEIQERSVDESTLQFIYRSAMQARQDVWIQCESLALLDTLSPRSLQRVIERRLGQPGDGDDLFLRRRAVVLLGENIDRLPALANMIPIVRRDPSPYVRQGLASVISRMPSTHARIVMRDLALSDSVPAVRACAICEAITLLERPEIELWDELAGLLREVFEKETSSFTLRAALLVASDGGKYLRATASPFFSTWFQLLEPAIERLHTTATDLGVRRWAAEARERLWVQSEPELVEIGQAILEQLGDSANGKVTRLRSGKLARLDDDTLGRWLAVHAQADYGFDIRRGRVWTRVGRGFQFGFRAWRALHEFRHPSPDKREAFPHTIGRIFRGNVRVPSAILSELAQTKVPGEPLFLSEEQGWRPFLPLVDDVISAVSWGPRPQPVRIYTAEGVTELAAPAGYRQRVRAYTRLVASFPHFARLRNWRVKEGGNPREYVEALRELGFSVEFRPHRYAARGRCASVDPAVEKFFPAGVPLIDSDLWDQLSSYFVSVYENSLWELALFAGAMTSIFIGRHFAANYSLKRSRENIPLVIGGWGTRGKSGTERLKAALFSALGYGFVSKTTGCEAMFLYAHTFGRTREMFLFRPYDKATIWEQRNVVRIAEKLGTDVFLWECMGLTPSYVEILQRQWMRDDLSTITNTYPDHEDLQGPAGINIPQVMCNFIPVRSTVYTSEEQMLPILVESARGLETSLHATGWLESGLLTDDVLKRFPYEEHPFNIALVAAMAEELGIDRDYALKEMADKVVADIGVLKTFPAAPVRSRKLEFTNGCSANERHGALGNWLRLGFDKIDAVGDPGTWICTVVNNRADRIARSRVFADVLVRDIAADRHVLIGSNLLGLRGYIREAWDSYSESISLVHENPDGVTEQKLDVLRGYFAWLRMPHDALFIEARLRAMLGNQNAPLDIEALVRRWREPDALHSELVGAGLASVADEIAAWVRDMGECLSEYEALSARVESMSDTELRETLWKWFSWKIVVIEDYFATGNQVIDFICSATPPGMFAKIMGLQNIKGTGLDFVYRWQAWGTCHDACRLLRSADLRQIETGLKDLLAFREYGVLCDEFTRETLEIVRRSPAAQRDRFLSDLEMIEGNLTQAMRHVHEQLAANEGPRESGGKWLEKICGVLEEFFDAGDAVKRRKAANKIYKDLIHERISSERAALELSALNKRQKGGWLYNRVRGARDLIARKASILQPKR